MLPGICSQQMAGDWKDGLRENVAAILPCIDFFLDFPFSAVRLGPANAITRSAELPNLELTANVPRLFVACGSRSPLPEGR